MDLLTTGSANTAEGTNASDRSTGISSDEGDLDLNDEFGEETLTNRLGVDFELNRQFVLQLRFCI